MSKKIKRDDWGFPVRNSSSTALAVQNQPLAKPTRKQQQEQLALLKMLTNNTVTSRAAFAQWMLDQLHDINKECGYPEQISANEYKQMFERDGYAKRVVTSYPTASWAVEPMIYETEDESADTEWELALDNIRKKFSLIEKWKRLDVLCGIAHYGVMLVGVDDGLPLDQPIAGVEEKLKKYFERDQSKKALLEQKQKQQPGQKPTDPNSTDPNAIDENELDAEGATGDNQPAEPLGQSKPYADQVKEDQFSADDQTPPNGKPKKKKPIGNAASHVSQLKGPLENEMPPSDGIRVDLAVDGQEETKGKKPRLLYLVPFDETQASIAAIENDKSSWRYGKPTYYNLTFFSPEDYTGVFATPAQSQTRVHWTRVVHVPDNCQSNEVFGTPRQKPVYNYLLNIRKILGGDAESMWKTGFPGYAFEVPPEINDQVELDSEALSKEVDLFMNTLKKYMALQGVQAKILQGQLGDPQSHVDVQILSICVALEIPKRIFMGTEEAKLAATEDADAWVNRVKGRNENQLTPRMIRPTLDLFMAIGLLPEIEEYYVDWPDLHTMSDKEKAEVALALTNALVAYIAGGGDTMIPPLEFLVNVFQWDRDLCIAVLRAAEQRLNENAESDAIEQEQAMQLDQEERAQQLEMQKTLADGLAEGAKAGGVHIPQQALPIPGAKMPNVGLRTPMSGGSGLKFGQKRLKGVADPFASSNINNTERSIDKLTANIERLINAFCPTGKGGGKDNSCSAYDDGGGSGGAGREYQQSLDGEFWLMDGQAMFADGDIGEMNHEGYAIDHAQREVMDMMGAPSEYTDGEFADWDEFISWLEIEHDGEDGYLKAMKEAGVSDELYQTALGMGDTRSYAAEQWGWIRMHGNNVQMRDASQLKELGDGIADAHQDADLDNESFTIETKTAYYTDVPWSVIDAGDVGALRDYKNPGTPGWGGTSNARRAKVRNRIRNIFCATGKEGGKDPTCTKDDGGGVAVAERPKAPQMSPREAKNKLFEAQEASKQREAKISQIIAQLKKLRKLDPKHPDIPHYNNRMEKLIEDRVKADHEVARLKKLVGNEEPVLDKEKQDEEEMVAF